MKRKHRRLMFVLFALVGLGAATALVLTALEENIVFFHSPTDVAEKDLPAGRTIRVGGLVVEQSIQKQADGVTVAFQITDMAHTLPIVYTGILPDLFREGQGIVAEGELRADGVFAAREVLAKHDETYMPPEVADALKKSGHWKETDGTGAEQ
ncbi:MAG: cytochrome c maturation protein CcmE [Alphaproteobacteria bacterium]|nr:cytochrome c maturation protein CcmE [Alphaproteobacteria bacterium]